MIKTVLTTVLILRVQMDIGVQDLLHQVWLRITTEEDLHAILWYGFLGF